MSKHHRHPAVQPVQPAVATTQAPAAKQACCFDATAPMHHACCKSGTAPTHDEIAERAYDLYVQAGREAGHCRRNWYAAEQSLRDQAPGTQVERPAEAATLTLQAPRDR